MQADILACIFSCCCDDRGMWCDINAVFPLRVCDAAGPLQTCPVFLSIVADTCRCFGRRGPSLPPSSSSTRSTPWPAREEGTVRREALPAAAHTCPEWEERMQSGWHPRQIHTYSLLSSCLVWLFALDYFGLCGRSLSSRDKCSVMAAPDWISAPLTMIHLW